MTFLAKPSANIKVDILQFAEPSTLTLNYEWGIAAGQTPINTSVIIDSSGFIQLHNNSNWRLEANCFGGFISETGNYEYIAHWYDGSSNLGNRGRVYSLSESEISRASCSLLLRSSDISGTITIRPRITTLTGNVNNYTVNAAVACVRIYEIKN